MPNDEGLEYSASQCPSSGVTCFPYAPPQLSSAWFLRCPGTGAEYIPVMLQLLWILIGAGAALVAVLFSSSLPYLVGGALVAAFMLWLLISTLSPAVPRRTCPKCAGQGLVKIRRGQPGVRCELCEFRDDAMHVAYLDEW